MSNNPPAPQSNATLTMPTNIVNTVAPEAANMLSNFWEKSKNADIENTVQTWLNELKKSTQAIKPEDTLGVLNNDTKQHLGDMVDVLQRLVKEKSSSKAVDNFLKNNNAELGDALKVLKNVGGQLGEEFGVGESDLNFDELMSAGEGIVGKYKERASILVTDGTSLMEQLVNSEEGQEIKKEGESFYNAISNTKGAKMLMESAKKIATSEKMKNEVGKLLQQAPSFIETTVSDVETQISELKVKDLTNEITTNLVNNDDSGIAKKLINENEGQGILQDLTDSKAVQDLKTNALNTINEVKGKGVGNTMEEVTSEVLGKGESMLEEFRATRKGQQVMAEGLKSFRKNVANKDALERAVSNTMEQIDAPRLVELSEKAWEDEDARSELFLKISDVFLEFLLKSLPAVAIPPISGVDDDVAYTIDGLDMSGFVIEKENVNLYICTKEDVEQEDWDGTVLRINATDMRAEFAKVMWSYRQNYFPYMSGQGLASATIQDVDLELSFKLVKETKLIDTKNDNSYNNNNNNDTSSIKQTLVPRLVLASNTLSMAEIELNEKGSTIGWVYNMLLGLFADVVKRYIILNVTEALDVLVDDFFDKLSTAAEAFNIAPILMRLTNINLNTLSQYDPTTRKKRGASLTIADGSTDESSNKPYSVTFRDEGKIGLRLGSDPAMPHFAVVIAFTRGKNDEKLQAEANGNLHIGDALMEINGKKVTQMPLQKVLQTFQAAKRPTTLVLLSTGKRRASVTSGSGGSNTKHAVVEVAFGPGPIGMELTSRESSGKKSKGAMIRSFKMMKDGTQGPAERCGKLQPSMILHACNDEIVNNYTFEDIMNCLRQASRPMVLKFLHDPDIKLTFRESGPIGLRLGKFKDYIVVTGFVNIRGPGESTGVIKQGHIVHMVGGKPCTVTAGSKKNWEYKVILNALRRYPRPIIIRFGPDIEDVWGNDNTSATNDNKNDDKKAPSSPSSPGFSKKKLPSEPLKWCDVTFGQGALGITFKKLENGRTMVNGFPKLQSPAQKRGDIIRHGMILLKLNGEEIGSLSLEEVIGRLRTTPPPRTLVFRDMDLYNRIHKIR